MSRNRNRSGMSMEPPKPDHSTAPPQALQEQEGFSFVVPTEFVELPSRGIFYPEDHPLHNQAAIEIKQMTAKEEDILTSRTLLKKGIALDRMLESLIRNKRIHPQNLLIGDRNAILVAARVSGYGNDYSTVVSCPNCSTKQKYTFDLNEANVYQGEDLHELEVINHEDGTFTTVLPKSKMNIRFKLLTGVEERNMVDLSEKQRKRNKQDNLITRQLKNLIVSVNDYDTAEAIDYVVENLPSMDSRHLRSAYKLAAPNIDLSQDFECDSCGHEQEMEVPLTAYFFWRDR